jgi:hypothetical protein
MHERWCHGAAKLQSLADDSEFDVPEGDLATLGGRQDCRSLAARE